MSENNVVSLSGKERIVGDNYVINPSLVLQGLAKDLENYPNAKVVVVTIGTDEPVRINSSHGIGDSMLMLAKGTLYLASIDDPYRCTTS